MKLLFRIEAIIGDRHDSPDSLDEDEIHQWLLNLQKQDILKVETETEYWEDVPVELFDLIKNNICLLYTSPSPRDGLLSRMPSSA